MSVTFDQRREQLLHALGARERCAGHDIVAVALRRLGITHVFGVGGVPVDATLGACARLGLRVIGARHQQGAVLMSLAYNYVSGGLHSAVIVSAGPAVTNCATGLLVGKDNCWPLLVIGGRRSLAMPGGFQAFDGASFLSSVAKWTALVTSASQLEEVLTHAARIALAGAPGPVYIDAAEEALDGRAPPPLRSMAAFGDDGNTSRCSDSDIVADARVSEAAALIEQARRPVMLIGKGARWSATSALLGRLADQYGVAFAASPMGCGLLPDDHPLCFSALRARMLAGADLVLVIGARLNWTFRFGSEISARARVIRIDIDPSEAANVLGRGWALPGDAGAVLTQLLRALDTRCVGASAERDRDRDWLASLSASRDALEIGRVPAAERGLAPMSPYEWLGEVSEALPAEAITVLDGNTILTAAQRMLPVRRPVTRLGPGTNGCMGVGIPFAIGAKLARPSAPVVAIVGDYGFGLNAFELETAVRHGVPAVFVVANNAGAGGAVRQRQFFAPDFSERVSRFGADVRHDVTMRSFGGVAYRIERPGQIAAVMKEAIACGQPACIDVITNENTALAAAI
jgi:thiamine pyrophosphate-dependent acetolactate synthase large subunit-like protein